jgi:hypothetical protein
MDPFCETVTDAAVSQEFIAVSGLERVVDRTPCFARKPVSSLVGNR